jgi:hypothetical protein
MTLLRSQELDSMMKGDRDSCFVMPDFFEADVCSSISFTISLADFPM